MCIALPMKLVEITAPNSGVVEFDGVRRKVNLKMLPNVEIGDFILIHAGYAIEKIDYEAANEQLELMEELKKSLE